jgi:hypothetical protein
MDSPVVGSNGNMSSITTAQGRPEMAQVWDMIKPKRQAIYVEQAQVTWMVQGMSAGQKERFDAQQQTVIRLKQDGTAEYDMKLNQLRAAVVCDNTYWPDGSKVFSDPMDPMRLADSDNAVVSLLYGAIDELSTTTKEQLDKAKNGSMKTRPTN